MSGIKPSQGGTMQVVDPDTTLSVEGILDIPAGGVLKIGGVAVTSTAAELNGMDGVTSSPAELNILDGVLASTAEINAVNGAGAALTFAIAAGGTNISEVTITVKDADGATVAAVHHLDVWLSDAASGQGLTGTTASGAVAAKAASGTDLIVLVAKKATRVQTLATGVYVLSITDSAKTGFYVAATIPLLGKAAVSAQLVTGDYG